MEYGHVIYRNRKKVVENQFNLRHYSKTFWNKPLKINLCVWLPKRLLSNICECRYVFKADRRDAGAVGVN